MQAHLRADAAGQSIDDRLQRDGQPGRRGEQIIPILLADEDRRDGEIHGLAIHHPVPAGQDRAACYVVCDDHGHRSGLLRGKDLGVEIAGATPDERHIFCQLRRIEQRPAGIGRLGGDQQLSHPGSGDGCVELRIQIAKLAAGPIGKTGDQAEGAPRNLRRQFRGRARGRKIARPSERRVVSRGTVPLRRGEHGPRRIQLSVEDQRGKGIRLTDKKIPGIHIHQIDEAESMAELM